LAIYCTILIIEYDETTISNHIIEFLIPAFAFVGSLPVAQAKINISPDTTRAIVTTVHIKNVADNNISCTNNSGELASAISFLIHRNW
jgi:hypothetical protein